jgi:hypothetical protein
MHDFEVQWGQQREEGDALSQPNNLLCDLARPAAPALEGEEGGVSATRQVPCWLASSPFAPSTTHTHYIHTHA